MTTHKSIRRFREGEYLAEVEVEVHEVEGRAYDTLSLADVRKLETVRKAMAVGDLEEASKHARLYRVTPLNAAAGVSAA